MKSAVKFLAMPLAIISLSGCGGSKSTPTDSNEKVITSSFLKGISGSYQDKKGSKYTFGDDQSSIRLDMPSSAFSFVYQQPAGSCSPSATCRCDANSCLEMKAGQCEFSMSGKILSVVERADFVGTVHRYMKIQVSQTQLNFLDPRVEAAQPVYGTGGSYFQQAKAVCSASGFKSGALIENEVDVSGNVFKIKDSTLGWHQFSK